MNRLLGYVLAAVGVASLALLAWALLGPGARGAEIAVTCSPEHASLWLDGHFLGTAPLTHGGVPPGRHVLRAVKFGHRPLVREIDLAEGPNAVRLELTALAGGTLSITTEPSGAEVVVDGEPRGVTPVVLKGLGPGGHPVRLSLVNYLDWTGSAEIEEGRTAEIKTELKPRTEAHYLEAIRLKPKDAALQCDLGHYYILRGEWKKAEDAFAQSLVLVATESQSAGYANRVQQEVEKVFRRQFQYEAGPSGQETVINALARAIKSCPRYNPYYMMALNYLTDRGMADKGREIIETGIVAMPYDYSWAVQMLQRRNDNLDRLLDEFDARLKRDPGDFVARFQRAVVLRQQGENEDAALDYEELSRRAKSADAKAKLLEECGRLHERAKNYDKAAAAYTAAARIEPDQKDRAPVYYNLVRALMQLNRPDDVDAAWKQAVDAQPDVEIACRWRIEWAQFNIGAGKPDRARAALDEILRISHDERSRTRAQELLDSLKKE